MYWMRCLRSWRVGTVAITFAFWCLGAHAQDGQMSDEDKVKPSPQSVEETIESIEEQMVQVRSERRQLSVNREAMRQNMTTGAMQMQRQRQDLIREDEQLAALYAEASDLESRLLSVRQRMLEILEEHPALVEQNRSRAAVAGAYNEIAMRERELADLEYDLVLRLAQLRRDKDTTESVEISP